MHSRRWARWPSFGAPSARGRGPAPTKLPTTYAAFASVTLAPGSTRLAGLEIHGYEIVDNYFFSQLVAGLAIGFTAAALWLERLGVAAYRIDCLAWAWG